MGDNSADLGDEFILVVKEGEKYLIDIDSYMDTMLTIEDADGKEVASLNGFGDTYYMFTTAGIYTIKVSDESLEMYYSDIGFTIKKQ